MQVPSDNDDEADGKDEAICPTDMNVITGENVVGTCSSASLMYAGGGEGPAGWVAA